MSADSPLNINLDVEIEEIPPAIAEIVRLTIEQQYRWRTANIDIRLSATSQSISGIPIVLNFPPHLEDLNVRIENGAFEPISDTFYRLNTLSSTRLARLAIPSARVIIAQPLGFMERLTSLCLYEIDFDALPAILRCAPNIATVDVGFHGRLGARGGGIVLEKLWKFTIHIRHNNVSSLIHFLGLLSAPTLRSLRFMCGTWKDLSQFDLPIWATLGMFLHRSNALLEILALRSRGESHTIRMRVEENPTSDVVLMGFWRASRA